MRGHFNFAKVQRGRNDDVNEGAKSEGGREKLTAAAAARLLSGLGAWHPLLRHLIRPPYWECKDWSLSIQNDGQHPSLDGALPSFCSHVALIFNQVAVMPGCSL